MTLTMHLRYLMTLDNCKNNDSIASGIAKISDDPSLSIYSADHKISWLQLFTQAKLWPSDLLHLRSYVPLTSLLGQCSYILPLFNTRPQI